MARERTQDAFDKTGEVLVATKDKVTETVASAAPGGATAGGATAGAAAGTSPAQPKSEGGDDVTRPKGELNAHPPARHTVSIPRPPHGAAFVVRSPRARFGSGCARVRGWRA